MANAPAKSRNTSGELSSQADTEYGFNPARKSADGCKEHLTYITLIWSLNVSFRSITAVNDMKHGELFEAYQ